MKIGITNKQLKWHKNVSSYLTFADRVNIFPVTI